MSYENYNEEMKSKITFMVNHALADYRKNKKKIILCGTYGLSEQLFCEKFITEFFNMTIREIIENDICFFSYQNYPFSSNEKKIDYEQLKKYKFLVIFINKMQGTIWRKLKSYNNIIIIINNIPTKYQNNEFNIIKLFSLIEDHKLCIKNYIVEKKLDLILYYICNSIGTLNFFIENNFQSHMENLINFFYNRDLTFQKEMGKKFFLKYINQNLPIVCDVLRSILDLFLMLEVNIDEINSVLHASSFLQEINKIKNKINVTRIMMISAEYNDMFNTIPNLQKQFIERTVFAICLYIQERVEINQ